MWQLRMVGFKTSTRRERLMSIKDKKYIKIIVFVVCAVLILWLFGCGWMVGWKSALLVIIGPKSGRP
jgi:hypothetical protein